MTLDAMSRKFEKSMYGYNKKKIKELKIKRKNETREVKKENKSNPPAQKPPNN
jgi:hypothetical protein